MSRYSILLTWFFKDSIWRNKWRSTQVLGAGFLGVAFQVQVFAMIIYYAQGFSSGDIISLAGYDFDPRTSIGLLAVGSITVFLSLTLSALCIYFSGRNILRMGREYEEFCAKRVFYLLGTNTDPFSEIEDEYVGDSYLIRLVRMDARLSGRVLRMMLSLIIPCITFLVAGSVIFYMEPVFSLLIALLGIIFLFFQYKVSKTAVAHSIRFEKLAPVAGREYKNLIQHCKEQACPDENKPIVKRIFSSGPVKKYLDAYEGRIRAMDNSRLVGGLFMAVVIGLIIFILGGAIIREGSGWGRLLVYVVALRFAMTNLQSTFITLTAINRFYPQVRRNFLFVQSFDSKDMEQSIPLEKYELRLVNENSLQILEGSEPSLIIRPGTLLSLVTPMELNRYTMADIIKFLLDEDEQAFKAALYSSRFATSRHSIPHCSLGRILDLPEGSGWKDVNLPVGMTERLKSHLPKNLDRNINPKVWEKVDPDLKFALSMVSALASDAQWILLEENGLRLLDDEAWSFFQGRMADRIAVVVFKNALARVGGYGEQISAVTDENRLIGLGTPVWFADVRKEAQSLLFGAGKGKTSRGGPSDGEELEET